MFLPLGDSLEALPGPENRPTFADTKEKKRLYNQSIQVLSKALNLKPIFQILLAKH